MSEKDLKEFQKDLPKDWKVFHSTKSKRVYYYNNVTKKTQWQHPCRGEKNVSIKICIINLLQYELTLAKYRLRTASTHNPNHDQFPLMHAPQLTRTLHHLLVCLIGQTLYQLYHFFYQLSYFH